MSHLRKPSMVMRSLRLAYRITMLPAFTVHAVYLIAAGVSSSVQLFRKILRQRQILGVRPPIVAKAELHPCPHEGEGRGAKESGGPACLLIPAYRRDGVGIQMMLRLTTMFIAKQTGASFVYIPFLDVAHKDDDESSASLTRSAWSSKWDAFFNIGETQLNLVDACATLGTAEVVRQVLDRGRWLGSSKGDNSEEIVQIINRLRAGKLNGLYMVNMGVCKKYREIGLSFDSEFLENVRSRFEANTYTPTEALYSDTCINIAVHIRRGDLLGGAYPRRLIPDEWYCEVLSRLQGAFLRAGVPATIHLFTDGSKDDVMSIISNDDVNSNAIKVHSRLNTFDTIYHMAKADILVPVMSTFSALAALLTRNVVIVDETFMTFSSFGIMEEFMRATPQYVIRHINGSSFDDIPLSLSYAWNARLKSANHST